MAIRRRRTPSTGKRARATTRTRARRAAAAGASDRLEFNHAMVYTTDVQRSLGFYRDRLGFTLLDEYPGAYARLRSPGGRTTIALHLLDRGMTLDTKREGMRLYFEIRRLDAFCRKLEAAGVTLSQPPKDMPWGWRHAYLQDPDGHEISLYWAGAKRFRKTTMRDDDGH
jgi:catechol 2,3-dioxygenase-like lactoylglutathione lyase family enzyme